MILREARNKTPPFLCCFQHENTRTEATMSRHDGKTNASRSYPRQLHRAIGTLLPHQGLRLLPLDDKERWTPRYLVITALLMACLGGDLLVDRFATARRALVGMYPTRRRPGKSYQGFAAALQRLGDALLAELAGHLRVQTRRQAGERWLIDGWPVFGGDGSRFDKTRTTANKEHFKCGGKQKTGPQQFLTTLFHVGTGLPWCWRAGDAKASERHQLRAMLPQLPAGALVLMDAGYSGYELLKDIITSGRSFILRVGAGVELLEGLGYDYQRRGKGVVSLWPKSARRRGGPPLTLRLVSVIGKRGRRMHLLTNVLERSRLSDAAARKMYRLRWGVEVLFRSIKQTMQLRKARSWTPRAAAAELEWGMTGAWMLGLLALAARPKRRAPANAPAHRWSAAGVLRVVRMAIRGTRGRGRSLRRLLAAAVRDGYPRRGSKTAIGWAHKKREKPPGDPRRRKATRAEVKAARELKPANPATPSAHDLAMRNRLLSLGKHHQPV
jgi:Transposase DDE domain